MKNRIIKCKDLCEIPSPSPETLVITIDGRELDTCSKFIEKVESLLQFPRPCEGNLNRFFDWIRDLTWFSYSGYAIVIKNYDLLMCKDIELKKNAMRFMENEVLPYWEHDVVNEMAGGTPHEFNIYIIE